MFQNDTGNHYKKPMSLLMLAWHNPTIPYFKRITHMVTNAIIFLELSTNRNSILQAKKMYYYQICN